MFRVMALQETHEEVCVCNFVADYHSAWLIAERALQEHEEWCDAWVEREYPLSMEALDDLRLHE